MRICHINLARGFRGGERQTELLISELALNNIPQILVCRADSPMRTHLADVPLLRFHTANHFLGGHTRTPRADFMHAHDAKGAHWANWEFRLRKTPYLITRRVPNPLKKNIFTRSVYRDAKMIVALSVAIEHSILTYLPSANTQIIPSMCAGLSHNKGTACSVRRRFSGKTLVGHIGALVDKHKGQSCLIEAARLLQNHQPQLHFLLLGQGKDEEGLRKQAEGLSNVTFEGFHSNVGDYLAAFDIFAFPSRQEGLGSILLDAMDYGLPIVASNVDGIPDIVKHEHNGLLVPPADAQALACAIESVVSNQDIASKLGKNGQKMASLFTPTAITQQYLELYQSITPKG
ncbi:glycosyltransferase family 4 protein [Desulfurispira natronophila]|uniref:Glycosyltransferase involved in cell wall biosynthesis n=1 Tax=Desulfurispira natronophila TaxID=682562 RepID=A0A7W8DH04_9BACT|nr:glycosyltransferase family 4 protein [Desulfurispira natronophila]MBB5021887.1 glycosyltransferase involved in cell wall biosynthesis [Desulfurispira natronophila]